MKQFRYCWLVLILTAAILLVMTGCEKKDCSGDLKQEIAQAIQVDEVEVFDTQKIGEMYFAGYRSDGNYSFAVFSQSSKGEYHLEYAALPEELEYRGPDIWSQVYNEEYEVLVSSNPKLARVVWNHDGTDITEVSTCPALIIKKKSDVQQYQFYDLEGNALL